ncbi:hypothetical protein OSB04_032001 [Centaurea solstitialis]|uniref:Uncharacterized protein n=1 Tax=Centaurea solstitialis TaxID=347529 RepID=A0AA38SI38_9ASTR|nr:hypothetical protein OSB04_032001 [Centaurea solstitialis]
MGKILNEVAEDVNDVNISSDGSWTIVARESQTTESNRNTIMSQDYHVLEKANYTLPNSSSFVIHNSSVLAIGTCAQRPSAIWQSTITRGAVSPAQIQQLGDSRLQSQVTPSYKT